MEVPAKSSVRFSGFVLDLSTGELRSNGNKSYLQEKPLKILTLLLLRPGELVTRDQLVKQLWPDGVFVDFDQSLNKAVNRLREALGDSADQPKFIETLPRRGYRFIGEVENDAKPAALAEQPVPILRPKARASSSSRMKWLAVAMLVVVAAAALLLWFRKHRPLTVVEFRQRQLTANSSENAVTGAAISSGGDYLAYADLKGIHVETIATGETEDIPEPESLRGMQVSWNIPPNWSHESTGFLANAIPHGQRTSIWFVPLTGEAPRKLRDDAFAWAISRDGSSVAFGSNLGDIYYREIWLMSLDGGQQRKLFEADEHSAFAGAEWSPDGQRLAYVKWYRTGDKEDEVAIESRSLKGGSPTTALSGADAFALADWAWSRDGRIISSIQDTDDPRSNTCNFWESRVDARTGRPLGKPRRLTNWSGFCMDETSLSADGKRLAFRKGSVQTAVYLADLGSNGTAASTPQRFTLNEGRNYPGGWTADSETLIFASNRNGRMEIFKQPLDQASAQPVGAVLEEGIEFTGGGLLDMVIPRLSPDGASILYLVLPKDSSDTAPVRLMRIPVAGGRPQLVLTTTLGKIHSLRCSRLPSSVCALAERTSDNKHLSFSALDPVSGRGRQLAVFATQSSPDAEYAWDLSADGSRIAILKRSDSVIHLLSLTDQSGRDLEVKAWGDFQSLDWTADGKGLLVSSSTHDGSALLRVDLNGHADVLWKFEGSVQSNSYPFFSGSSAPWAVPSPDGRHLAICRWNIDANVWMIENF